MFISRATLATFTTSARQSRRKIRPQSYIDIRQTALITPYINSNALTSTACRTRDKQYVKFAAG